MTLLARLVAPYTSGLRGIDRRAYVVVTVTLLAVASRMSVYTFLGIYFTRELGFPLPLVGLAYLVENLGRGLVAPLGGALSDRFGRRPVLLASSLVTAAVLPAFLLVRTPLELLVWSATLGAGMASSWPATSALLLDLSPPERRQSVLSLNYTAISIGYTIGVAPAGFLLKLGYPVLAAASACGFLGIALLVALALRGPLPLGIGLIATVTPLYAESRGVDEGDIGLALALNGPLLAALAIPVAVWLAPRGPYRHLALSAAVLGASYLGLVVSGSFAALLVSTVVFTVGELIFSSALPAAVASLAPPGLRGAYQGSWVLVFAIASGSALFATGLLEAAFGWRATWIVWSALTGLAAVGLALARPTFRRIADERSAA